MMVATHEVEITRRFGEAVLVNGVPVRVTAQRGGRLTIAVPAGTDVAKPEDLEFSETLDGWDGDRG